MSIPSAYQQCMRSAHELCDALRAQGSENIPTSLRNDIGRFKVWAQNAGAHRKSTNSMSLEHRLREASDVRNMVITLLEDLRVALRDAMSATLKAPVPRTNDLAITSSDAAEASRSGTPKSEDSDSDSDSDSDPEESNEFEQCLLDIANIVTCLYNLSIAIANPAPRDRLEKCASIDVSHFQQHDIEHVSYKFPEAEEYLIERLGKANTKRRQLLRYYERHREKIAGQPRSGLDSESLAGTTCQTVTTVSTYVPVEGIMATGPNIGLDDDPDPDFDSRSVTSYASSIGNSDPDRLRVPPPPNEESAFEGIPFECPYCMSMVKVENQQSWKRHVFRDLRPYVCTFRDCQRSEHLFESRHDWFEHERTMHRREWFCSACQELFPTSAAFQNHLSQSHAGQLDPQVVVDRSERAIESKQRCNLCGHDNLSPHLLQRHIGRHMQQISLFVVPGSGMDDEESDKNSSESAGPEERSDDEELQAEERRQAGGDSDAKELPADWREKLYRAAESGDEATVRLLLDRGAEIEAKDNYNWTALHIAAENGQEATVRLLLDRGAEIEAKDNDNWTALHIAAENGKEATVRLLLDRGAEIDAKNNDNRTALHVAAQNGKEATVRLLLDRGAEIQAKDNSGETALRLATRQRHMAIAQLLRDRGAT